MHSSSVGVSLHKATTSASTSVRWPSPQKRLGLSRCRSCSCVGVRAFSFSQCDASGIGRHHCIRLAEGRHTHHARTHASVRMCACTIGALFGPQKKEKINPNKYTLLYPPLHVAAKYGHVQVRLACPPASLPACMRSCFALCWSVHLLACVAASTARGASAASVA